LQCDTQFFAVREHEMSKNVDAPVAQTQAEMMCCCTSRFISHALNKAVF